MNFNELCIKIQSNEITFDYAGHACNDAKQSILDKYQSTIDGASGKYDNTWSLNNNESKETTNIRMREFYQNNLNKKLTCGEPLFDFSEHYCFGCGEKLYFVLNDNVLVLKNRWVHDETAKFGVKQQNYPKEYRCTFENPQPFCGSINIEQALIFANYFDFPDTSEGNEYNSEWSLNCIAGRYRRAEYKCRNYNVAYGQMSNMSIGIYLHKDKNIIIVGPKYHPADFEDDLTDEEYEAAIKKPAFERFDLIGTLCLDVWRFEATDSKLIKAFNNDSIKVDVKPGIWKFEHYFDCLRYNDGNNHVYAKLFK